MKLDRSSEYFFRLPMRVGEALQRGELTFLQYAVLVGLAYLAYESKTHGRIETTLATLADRICWPHSQEYLRQALRALAESGWIRAEVPTGGRMWSIVLVRAAVETGDEVPPTDLQPNEPSELEVDESEFEDSDITNVVSKPDSADSSAEELEVASSLSPLSIEVLSEVLDEEKDLDACAREDEFIEALTEMFDAHEVDRRSVVLPLCRYPAHRATGLDWIDGGRVVCGVCHPDHRGSNHEGVTPRAVRSYA